MLNSSPDQIGGFPRGGGDGTTRSTLLSQIRSNPAEEKHWTEFYYYYRGLIHGTARRFGLSDADAEEVCQETLVTLSKALPDFRYDRKRGSFRSWLMNLTRWKVLDHLKHLKQGSQLGAASVQLPSADEFEQRWLAEWKQSAMKMAWHRLQKYVSPDLLQIYDLCIVQEKGVRGAAEILGLSRPAVYIAIHRIKGHLKREIARLKNDGF